MNNDYYQPVNNSSQPQDNSGQQDLNSSQQSNQPIDNNQGEPPQSDPIQQSQQIGNNQELSDTPTPVASQPNSSVFDPPNAAPPISDPTENNGGVTPSADQIQPVAQKPIESPSPIENNEITSEEPPIAPSTSGASDDGNISRLIEETKEKIIRDLGFEEASQEQKDKILDTIDKRIMVATTQAVIENSTDEEAQKIRSSIENNEDVEKAVEEIVANNPGLAEKIKVKIEELYQTILDESKQVNES